MTAGDHSVAAILVEDDRDLREALVGTLGGLGLTVTGTGCALEFYQSLLGYRYDLAIVDRGLPDGDGLSIVRFLAERGDMGIIILTAAGETENRIDGFRSGADLYFVKPVDCRELAAAATRLTMRRATCAAAALVPAAPSGCWIVRPAQWQLVSPAGAAMPLTPKEMEFVNLLARHHRRVVCRSDALRLLAYHDDTAGNRRLDALVSRLRLKAESLLGRSLPVSTVHGVGYTFSAPMTIDAPAASTAPEVPVAFVRE